MTKPPGIGRRRNLAKLSKAESKLAVEAIVSHTKSANFPKAQTARILGCSHRTASRIIASNPPFTARLKRAYAANFARHTGTPLERIVKAVEIDYADALRGWLNMRPSEAVQTAAIIASGIASRAMIGYSLLPEYTVSHGNDGMPLKVTITLQTPPPAMLIHKLEFREENGGIYFSYFNAAGSVVHHARPTEHEMETVLLYIKNEKHHIKA